MLTLALWWTGLALELLILVRAAWNGVLRQYPFFGAYLFCVWLGSLSSYLVYRKWPAHYAGWFWTFEFAGVLAGYCVMLEIFEKGLGAYPGPRKISRNGALVVFCAIVAFTWLQWVVERHTSSFLTDIEVERNLRTAEAVLLAGFLVLVWHYGIPLTRNLKGIALGYGAYVAIDVMAQAARSRLGLPFHALFSWIRAFSYLGALVAWTVALWAYSPVSMPAPPQVAPPDYGSLAEETRRSLEAARAQLEKVGRR